MNIQPRLTLTAFESKTFAANSLLAALIMYTVLSQDAYAGAGGAAEFGSVYTLVQGYMQGMLGKLFAISVFAIGMAAAIVKQSLMGIPVAVGSAIATYYGPNVIDSLVAAAIPLAPGAYGFSVGGSIPLL